jgi:hypothetical protein
MYPQGLYRMPIPGMDNKWEEESFRYNTYWRLRFLWLPKRSAITGRQLWLRQVYEGTRMITGPGDPVFLFRYHEPAEHIIWQLKGN